MSQNVYNFVLEITLGGVLGTAKRAERTEIIPIDLMQTMLP